MSAQPIIVPDIRARWVEAWRQARVAARDNTTPPMSVGGLFWKADDCLWRRRHSRDPHRDLRVALEYRSFPRRIGTGTRWLPSERAVAWRAYWERRSARMSGGAA